MGTELEFPTHIADVRESLCHRCLEPLPGGPEDGGLRAIVPGQQSEGRTTDPLSPALRARRSAPGPFKARMCDRCLFLLLLEAIAELVPVAEVLGWMERPN